MSVMTTTQKASYDALVAQLGSVYLLVTATFTTGTTQPASIADALMTGQTAGGAAGPGQGGTQGIVAGSFASGGAETGTGSGQGGLTSAASSTQPYNATDFPGGQFAAPLLKSNGEPVALLDALTTAGASFPASVAAPVVVFWAHRSDLGADAKWRTFFYFRDQATGNWTAFTPNASLANVSLYVPKVLLQSAQPTAAGFGNSLATAGAAEVEFGATGDIQPLGTVAGGSSGKVADAAHVHTNPVPTTPLIIFDFRFSAFPGTANVRQIQPGGASAALSNGATTAYILIPFALTVLGMRGIHQVANATDGATYTLLQGVGTGTISTASNGMTFTIAANAQIGSDTTVGHAQAYAAGDCLAVQFQSSGTTSTAVNGCCTVWAQPS